MRAIAWLALLATGACSGELSVLDPRGPGAARIERLWWVLFALAAAVCALVALLILYSLRRGRRDLTDDIDKRNVSWGDRFIGITGAAIPVVILMGTFLYSLGEMNRLAAGNEDETDLAIEVIAHNWWWEARYPNGATTANEIHIPTGERVRVVLQSADVLHSFWVPRLQAKMDNIPGTDNEIWIEADSPGRYRGQCAEFCGLQHAHMAVFVVAQSPSDFAEWYANEASPAPEPATASAGDGEEVFLSSSCVGCHAIRGTEADAEVGPDLTHLAGRRTLLAGKMPSTRSVLETLIVDPQSLKPGIGMPPTELTAAELEALLDYLESLR